MCGIIAVVRRNTEIERVAAESVTAPLQRAAEILDAANGLPNRAEVTSAAAEVETANGALRSADGVYSLIVDAALTAEVDSLTERLVDCLVTIDEQLDDAAAGSAPAPSRR